MRKAIRKTSYNNFYLMLACGLMIFSLYCFYLYHVTQKSLLEKIDHKLYQAALGTEFLLNSFPEVIAGNEFMDTELYDDLNFQLSEFAKKSGVSHVYSLEKYRDDLVFTSNSYTETSGSKHNYRSFMEIYHETDKQIIQTFTSIEPLYINSASHGDTLRLLLLPTINERGNLRIIVADVPLAEVAKATNNALFQALFTAGYFIIFSLLLAFAYMYRIRIQLTTDAITGFPNHSALEHRLKHKEETSLVAVIGCKDLIDINSFYGQHTLDLCMQQILISTARKLGSNYICYRLTHNKAAVVANNCISRETFIAVLKNLNIGQPLLSDPIIYTHLQIGVAEDLNTEVLENALLAEATARTDGVELQYYSNALNDLREQYQNNLLMSGKVSEAFNELRFIAYFQPIICTQSRKIVKYEALVRLKSSNGDLIAPYKFLPVITRSRLDQKLVKVMFSQCRDKFNGSDICWSINLSVDDMVDPALCQWLIKELQQYSDPSNITFELLETEGIDNFAHMKLYIDKYRAFGVKIYVDDFGVGYSNISHFLKLNVDGLKLDGSLVERICIDKDVRLFIEYIVQFANTVGIKVVAEYIETEQILNAVTETGVHMAQGYYFSAPQADIQLNEQVFSSSNRVA